MATAFTFWMKKSVYVAGATGRRYGSTIARSPCFGDFKCCCPDKNYTPVS